MLILVFGGDNDYDLCIQRFDEQMGRYGIDTRWEGSWVVTR